MVLLKKNWGLLIYALVCLGLSAFLGLKISAAEKTARENQKKLKEQLSFFDGVKKDNIKLNEDNQRIAQANRDLAEAKFMQLRRTLAGKYRIEPDPPPTAVEGVRRLQQEIRRMTKKLEEADIVIGQQCQYFSFDKLAMSRKLPPESDVPEIFRHLRVVQEIVRLIGESEVMQVERIDRPMGLQRLDEDLYTVTPLTIVVTGRPEQVQTFINKMNSESNYLFFLRKVDLLTADQAPGGILSGKDTGVRGGGGPGMDGMGPEGAGMMMDPGMDMGAPEMGGEMPGMAMGGRGRRPTGGPNMMGPDMGGEGMPGARRGNAELTGPLTRQDLLAFESGRALNAELRFDLVEFIPPKEE
jgi:hypothetical protein